MMEKLFMLDLQWFATPVQPVPGTSFDFVTGDGNVIHYTDSDRDNEANFGKLLEPGLRKIFFETYGELPEQYSKIYNMKTSSKAKEYDWGMGAFGDWTQRTSQVDEVAYKTLSPGLERTYTHNAFTQGFMITREMYEDEQYGQMEKMAKAMARSGRAKVEKDAIQILTDAFTVNGYDGVPLCSDSHPLLDSASSGDNLTTGVLSDTNLKKAIQLMKATVDEAGNLIQLNPTVLVVPPALEDTALRLLNSQKITGSDHNDTNMYLSQAGIQVLVMDYLSAAAGGSDTAWFLMDGMRHELNFFWRIRPEFKNDDDFDTFVAKYRGYMRYSYGYSDWRGIVGSTGQ